MTGQVARLTPAKLSHYPPHPLSHTTSQYVERTALRVWYTRPALTRPPSLAVSTPSGPPPPPGDNSTPKPSTSSGADSSAVATDLADVKMEQPEEEQEVHLPDEIANGTPEDILTRVRLIDNELKVSTTPLAGRAPLDRLLGLPRVAFCGAPGPREGVCVLVTVG